MSKNYDNWERLVDAVLLREKLREIALEDPRSLSNITSISSDFSFTLNSDFATAGDSSAYQQDLRNSAHIFRNIESRREKDKIVRMEGCRFSCNVQDFLAAPAELLGRGIFGGTYKVMLDKKTTAVVKRVRIKIARREAEPEIHFLGSIRHENIVPIIAYFYFEKAVCLVYDLAKQGLGSILHDKIGRKQRPLRWETRRRVALGAARGIAHIHAQRGRKLLHGNIKASNIFVNSQQYGCISDHCLVTIDKVNKLLPMLNTGYQAPEITDLRQVSQASDVYSFGVVLLELLTRKSPDGTKLGNEVVGLVRWVNCVASKKGTSKVLDSELVKDPVMEEEMVQVLLIAMLCVAKKPEQRPKMQDIVRMME